MDATGLSSAADDAMKLILADAEVSELPSSTQDVIDLYKRLRPELGRLP
jgi:hypothetical protein